MARFAPMRSASAPKANAKGTPTSWIMSRAASMLVWEMPISSP